MIIAATLIIKTPIVGIYVLYYLFNSCRHRDGDERGWLKFFGGAEAAGVPGPGGPQTKLHPRPGRGHGQRRSQNGPAHSGANQKKVAYSCPAFRVITPENATSQITS